jgi:hypothetical protein
LLTVPEFGKRFCDWNAADIILKRLPVDKLHHDARRLAGFLDLLPGLSQTPTVSLEFVQSV